MELLDNLIHFEQHTKAIQTLTIIILVQTAFIIICIVGLAIVEEKVKNIEKSLGKLMQEKGFEAAKK